MTYLMTSSFEKLRIRWFATFSFAFSGSRESAHSTAHAVSCEKAEKLCGLDGGQWHPGQGL